MDFISSFNPPRLVLLGGEPYWVRAMLLGDLAILVGWLDDILPGRAGRRMAKELPDLGGEAALNALDSPPGWALVAWLALRHQGVSYIDAARLAHAATMEEKARLLDVFYTRRRTLVPEGGKGVGEQWWGPGLCAVMERYGPDMRSLEHLSLDQLDMLITAGLEREEPRLLTTAQLDELDRIAMANRAAKEAAE